MKRLFYVVGLVSSLAIVSGCASATFRGTTTASPRLDLNQKRVALMYEVAYTDSSQLNFLSFLNEALIRDGYTVTERLDYPQVLGDIQEQSIRGNTNSQASSRSFSTPSVYGFSPRDIRKIGVLYRLDYLLVYSRLSNTQCLLRVIDCKTAEVVATSSMASIALGAVPSHDRIAAQMLVMSLRYADGFTDGRGNPKPVYLDISQARKKAGSFSRIERIFYQSPININGTPPYAIIYSLMDDKALGGAAAARSTSRNRLAQ